MILHTKEEKRAFEISLSRHSIAVEVLAFLAAFLGSKRKIEIESALFIMLCAIMRQVVRFICDLCKEHKRNHQQKHAIEQNRNALKCFLLVLLLVFV